MDITVRPARDADTDAVVRLSLRAWEPAFRSFRRLLGDALYTRLIPDWESSQSEAVAALVKGDGKSIVWVAEVAGVVAGFVAYVLDGESKTGEVTYLAVDPAFQRRGVGTELNRLALAQMKQAGMTMARVETAGDASHAAARKAYEKAGYTGLPLVRYFQAL